MAGLIALALELLRLLETWLSHAPHAPGFYRP